MSRLLRLAAPLLTLVPALASAEIPESFTADDGNGGVCTGRVTVCVSHDRAGACLDEGQAYDSLVQ